MTDDLVTRAELVRRLKDDDHALLQRDRYAAAARIKQDAATIARLEGERDARWQVEEVERLMREAHPILANIVEKQEAESLALEARAEAAEAKVAALVEALEGMRGAVCGETGFAECVRRDSGRAYPWPALDAADEAARAAIAAAKEGA